MSKCFLVFVLLVLAFADGKGHHWRHHGAVRKSQSAAAPLFFLSGISKAIRHMQLLASNRKEQERRAKEQKRIAKIQRKERRCTSLGCFRRLEAREKRVKMQLEAARQARERERQRLKGEIERLKKLRDETKAEQKRAAKLAAERAEEEAKKRRKEKKAQEKVRKELEKEHRKRKKAEREAKRAAKRAARKAAKEEKARRKAERRRRKKEKKRGRKGRKGRKGGKGRNGGESSSSNQSSGQSPSSSSSSGSQPSVADVVSSLPVKELKGQLKEVHGTNVELLKVVKELLNRQKEKSYDQSYDGKPSSSARQHGESSSEDGHDGDSPDHEHSPDGSSSGYSPSSSSQNGSASRSSSQLPPSLQSRRVRVVARRIQRLMRDVVDSATLRKVCRYLGHRRDHCRSARCRKALTLKIHGLCSTGCHTARLALETCVNARRSRAHTNRCLRRVLRRLRTKSCPLLGIDKNNAKSRLVRADVLAVTVESQCARIYGRYRRLNCEKSDSVTCRRLQRVYARRCSLRCHDLRTKAADCPGSHVKCFLQFARHLQAQKCSIVGTGRRDLPQPPSTSSSGTRNPDDDDDDEEDSGSFGGRAFGGSSSSSFQSNSSVSNVNSTSTNNGTLTARSASNSSAPGQDNTLFYVLIALMAALIFLVIVGIALMCIWWQPKSNSNYVEVEEDHKSSSSAF